MPGMDTLRAVPVTDVSKFSDIVAAGFGPAALSTTFIVEIDSIPPPYPSPRINLARRQQHFSKGIASMAESGADLIQAGDWSAIALWEPPNFKGKPFSELHSNTGPLMLEWTQRKKAAQARYMAGDDGSLRSFYHLAFLVRNPDAPVVPGAISAVMRPFLERAKSEGVVAWLEATNLHAVEVYKHYGFEMVEEIVFGVGKVGADGWPKEGGEGITAWCMLYDPHRT